jgi:hypothetical protein
LAYLTIFLLIVNKNKYGIEIYEFKNLNETLTPYADKINYFKKTINYITNPIFTFYDYIFNYFCPTPANFSNALYELKKSIKETNKFLDELEYKKNITHTEIINENNDENTQVNENNTENKIIPIEENIITHIEETSIINDVSNEDLNINDIFKNINFMNSENINSNETTNEFIKSMLNEPEKMNEMFSSFMTIINNSNINIPNINIPKENTDDELSEYVLEQSVGVVD